MNYCTDKHTDSMVHADKMTCLAIQTSEHYSIDRCNCASFNYAPLSEKDS